MEANQKEIELLAREQHFEQRLIDIENKDNVGWFRWLISDIFSDTKFILIVLVLLFGSFWFSSTEQGKRILQPIFGEEVTKSFQDNYFGLLELWENFGKFGFDGPETDITKYECLDVVDLVKDLKPKNMFGAEFDILTIKNVKLVSKNSKKITCSGDLLLSDGAKKSRYHIYAEQSDDGILYGFKQLY